MDPDKNLNTAILPYKTPHKKQKPPLSLRKTGLFDDQTIISPVVTFVHRHI